MNDRSRILAEQIIDAAQQGRTLNIVAGGSKAFFGREPVGERLDLSGHRGIVNYEPTELVITARAGTPLSDIEATLAERGQMLPFEPPHFSPNATLGGCIAAGLSGPRRPYAGSVRDYVLGARMINGRGEILRFGGEVMKNVAGYDVSRLLAGSLGILGPILEVSLKVLPIPVSSMTLVYEYDTNTALDKIIHWSREPLPISAGSWIDGRLYVRLCGAEAAVRSAQASMGGEPLSDAAVFWGSLKEHSHTYFATDEPLNRICVPVTSRAVLTIGIWEWGGAQRWVHGRLSDSDCARIAQDGGHLNLFRAGDRSGDVFEPLAPPLMELHQRIKASFDPHGLFNPGRLYAAL